MLVEQPRVEDKFHGEFPQALAALLAEVAQLTFASSLIAGS